MRIGVFSQAASLPDSTVKDVIAEARSLEAEGFDFISYPHIFGFDALTLAAVVGQQTQRIEITTGVVPSPPRHPYAMAQQALTVQAACAGRFSLGIGLSHQLVIEGMFGLSYAKPAKQMREYLSVLAPLLRGERASFDGDLYRVHAELKVSGADPVPLLIAALGPLMLEVAGTLADGTSTWMTGLRTLASHTVPRISDAARKAGRAAPRILAALPTSLVSDVDAARAGANESFAIYNNLPSYRAMLDREGEGCQPGDVAILGDEAELRASLGRLRDAGVTEFCAVLHNAEKGSGRRTREFLASERNG
jgi:5,10-methylenetetrahydromethanopterin reductase